MKATDIIRQCQAVLPSLEWHAWRDSSARAFIPGAHLHIEWVASDSGIGPGGFKPSVVWGSVGFTAPRCLADVRTAIEWIVDALCRQYHLPGSSWPASLPPHAHELRFGDGVDYITGVGKALQGLMTPAPYTCAPPPAATLRVGCKVRAQQDMTVFGVRVACQGAQGVVVEVRDQEPRLVVVWQGTLLAMEVTSDGVVLIPEPGPCPEPEPYTEAAFSARALLVDIRNACANAAHADLNFGDGAFLVIEAIEMHLKTRGPDFVTVWSTTAEALTRLIDKESPT